MTSLKKMPAAVDKCSVKKVCIDDFALRKKYTYGTVMVDLETHRIIDLIDSRETKAVEEWLKTYPNLEVISRDGAQTYSSAASNSHPEAVQVSDRFHLLKNLSEVVENHMRSLFPSRLPIPASSRSPEMEALLDTRNRAERIRFAHKKRKEGYTISDIALLLHSCPTTISKYLAIPESEIPPVKENVQERRHHEAIKNKQKAMDEVRELYRTGLTIEKISTITGHTTKTVRKYLKADSPADSGRYDGRQPGKLAPYEQEVMEMRSKGITYREIHEYICGKGYKGSEASLRVFMQKERTRRKEVQKQETEVMDYIPRKCLCQLIYHELENVKGITKEQYNEAIKKYPVLGSLYALLKEFHRIVFSQKSDELEKWMEKAEELKIEDLNSYINGLKNDLEAVKNGIKYTYNNGLAEGSVNKIKLTKRIMYGRNSFELLKAKLLLNEYFYKTYAFIN